MVCIHEESTNNSGLIYSQKKKAEIEVLIRLNEAMAEDRPEAWSWHLLGLVNPGIVFAGNLVGGIWVAAGVVYML